MLCQQPRLLLFDQLPNPGLFGLFGSDLLHLQFALGMIYSKFFSPEPLDFALVFLFAHPTFLVIHLLKTLILGKFLHQLCSENLFHALFFGGALSLETHLEVFCFLKFLLNSLPLFNFCFFSLNRSLFSFLVVEFIPKIFLELFLSPSCDLLCFKSFEYLVPCICCCVFRCLNLVHALLLLLGIPSDHFIFVALHFLLSPLLSSFLLYTQDHVSLSLFHFELLDTSHLSVFIDHALYDVVNLFFFLLILLVRFFFYFLAFSNLFLKHFFSLSLLFDLSGFSFELSLFLNLFVTQHNTVHLCIMFLKWWSDYNNYLQVRSVGGTIVQLFVRLAPYSNNWP